MPLNCATGSRSHGSRGRDCHCPCCANGETEALPLGEVSELGLDSWGGDGPARGREPLAMRFKGSLAASLRLRFLHLKWQQLVHGVTLRHQDPVPGHSGHLGRSSHQQPQEAAASSLRTLSGLPHARASGGPFSRGVLLFSHTSGPGYGFRAGRGSRGSQRCPQLEDIT